MRLSRTVTVNKTISLMNDLLSRDPQAVNTLINTRVKCNKKLADHPTVQVQQLKKDKFSSVGLLGILNGLFGIRSDGFGAICMEINDNNGKIIRFKETPRP